MVHTRSPATSGQEEKGNVYNLNTPWWGTWASPACLRHSEETTMTCHLILTQSAQKAASGQAPICQKLAWAASW